MTGHRSDWQTRIKTLLLASALTCGPTLSATAAPLPTLSAPVVDPAGVLSPAARDEVRSAAERFRRSAGFWLVVVVLPSGGVADLTLPEGAGQVSWADAPVGIVYATTPDESAGRLFVADSGWRRAAPDWWLAMFPQRLAEKFGEAPFEERIRQSAAYLADVFPDKIAFLMQPPDRIGEDSVAFAEDVMTVVKWFFYFIILFTAYRTFFPARLRDEDTDEVSQELRRLRNERQIW